MSIMAASTDKEVVEKDLNTLVKFCNRYGYSSFTDNLVNLNYNKWLELNYRSYNTRYNQNLSMPTIVKVVNVGNKEYDNYCQLLKRLQCIRYNIETEFCKPNYKEIEAINSLNDVIEGLKDWIIGELTDYKEAAYN